MCVCMYIHVYIRVCVYYKWQEKSTAANPDYDEMRYAAYPPSAHIPYVVYLYIYV